MTMDKKFSDLGGFAFLTPYQRLCPWTPLGDPPPDLLIGALSPWSPLGISWIRR